MKARYAPIRASSLIAVFLFALSGVVQAQFTYTTNNGTITIWSYNGSGGAVTIPDTVYGMPVASIRESAFRFSYVSSVTIPGSVVSIGDWAFANCTSLSSVTLSNGITSIGNDTFWWCLHLTSVTIPASVTSIGIQAFGYCTNLPAITVDPLNSVFRSVQGVLFDKSQTTLIQYPLGKPGSSYAVPAGTTTIANNAFSESPRLTTVIMPKSLASIGASAFIDCYPLTSIYFRGNAPGVGRYAFRNINATLYYLPGTMNWSSPFAGLPAVLWNPQAQTGDGSFGVQTNRFGFNITGSSNLVIVVEACTNLAMGLWSPVSTNTLNTFIGTNGTSYFSDSQWTNSRGRFYRLRSP